MEVGKNEGERVLGEDPGGPGKGYFVPLTVFAGVDPRAKIAQEEIFGPVLSVLKARDFDHALQIANDNPYGLTGGVYSKNRDHLERPARVQGRKRLLQPQDHRRSGRRPTFWRLRHERERLQGRRPRLPARCTCSPRRWSSGSDAIEFKV